MEKLKTYQDLVKEVQKKSLLLEETLLQLEEANDTINAIRSGEVDAFIVNGADGHKLYTLKTSDQTYRIFIEQMIEGAVTLNQLGNILYSNSQFADLVGLPLEKVIGQAFYKFIIPSQGDICNDLINQAWDKNTKGELTLLSYRKKNIPVLLSLKTLHLDEGLSLSIILTDLTSQKAAQELLLQKNIQLEEAKRNVQDVNLNLENTVKQRTLQLEKNIQEKTTIEAELRSNQERLTRILETMAEGVGIMDNNGKLTYANPMAQKILGIRQTGILEKKYHDPKWQHLRLDGSALPEQEHPMHVSIKTGKSVYDYEIGINPPHGSLFYISINAAPIYDDNGKIAGSIGTFMDVTNRRKALEQKDDFISVASHELKTPITTLKAYLQMLQKLKHNPTSATLPSLIDQANKSMDRVSRLIDDLLNTSRITQGQFHLHKTRFILSELATQSCGHIRTNDDFKIIIEGDMTLEVDADFDRLEQVMTNFVNNAVKYAPDGKEIYIRIEKINNLAKISVTDFGPGISADKIPHLFDRYYRVDEKGMPSSGLGLGLYISSEIIKKHGGQIGVDSKPGKGSSFWFTLGL